MPEPPHGRPRMHNVLPGSRSYVHHLERRARRTGVSIRTGVRARAILREGERVVGVTDERGDVWRARGAVVLAAGDFTAGRELKARYMGEREAEVEAVNPTATGDGQAMALAIGARVLNGDLALGPELRFVPPPRGGPIQRLPPWPVLATAMAWSLDRLPAWLLRPFVMRFVTTALAPSPALFEAGAILVDREGLRFCDEQGQPAYALALREGKEGFILLDARLARMFTAWPHYVSTAPGIAYAYLPDYRRNRRDVYAAAPDLDRLGARLALPPGALATTVADHNAKAGNRPRLETGPFVALGPVRPVFVHAEGGLAVDTRHRVLGEGDLPIQGLYACGSTGQGGLLLKGHGHHLAWAFVSGRRAGREAAFELATHDRQR